jgi:DNA-binding transcriptional MerR regulator
LGLLKPERTSAGYRVYREADMGRLEQIIALKFIGVPLREIKNLLTGNAGILSRALVSQLAALEEKKRLLDLAIDAIQDAEVRLRRGEQTESSALRRIIEVIEMQNNGDWMMKYFRPEVKERVRARKAAWTPEFEARAGQDWSELFHDIEAALDEDPAGPRTQALVDRWEDLIRALIGGDQELVHGVKAMYADRDKWPADFRARVEPFMDDRIWAFFRKGVAARSR